MDELVPEGFTLMDPYGPFHELVGPIYETRRNGNVVAGMRVAHKHRNKGSIMHGGMLTMLLDNTMTHACVQVRTDDSYVVTTSISTDFLAAAKEGDWIDCEVEILRKGRRVIFLSALIRRDGPEGEILVRGSASFQVVSAPKK